MAPVYQISVLKPRSTPPFLNRALGLAVCGCVRKKLPALSPILTYWRPWGKRSENSTRSGIEARKSCVTVKVPVT